MKNRIPKIIVIGDVIIDEYINGGVNRISPEAPVPVLGFKNQFYKSGGAANVAINVSRLCGSSILVLDGKNSKLHTNKLEEENIELFWNSDLENYCIKTRYLCGPHQLLRVDKDVIKSKKIEDYNRVLNTLETGDLVLISDYDKGALDCCSGIIDFCNSKKILTVTDPKDPHWSKYLNSTALKCNKKEFLDHRKADNLKLEICKDTLNESRSKYNIKYLIVTLGAEGLMIVDELGRFKSYKANNINVYDVSGAGDALAAGIAYLLIKNISIIDNGEFLCKLGALCVQEIGTSPVPKGFNFKEFN